MGRTGQSLKSNVRFNIANSVAEAKKACLFPGRYDTQKVEIVQDGSKAVTEVDMVETNKAVKPDPDIPVKPTVGTATEEAEHVLLNEKPHHADEPSQGGGAYGGATTVSVSGTEPAKGADATAKGVLSRAASLARWLWQLWLALALTMAMDKK